VYSEIECKRDYNTPKKNKKKHVLTRNEYCCGHESDERSEQNSHHLHFFFFFLFFQISIYIYNYNYMISLSLSVIDVCGFSLSLSLSKRFFKFWIHTGLRWAAIHLWVYGFMDTERERERLGGKKFNLLS
jgi:hypothetical protein